MSSSELYHTLNTGLGVGGQRTFDSRPAVLSPFIACRTVPALVLLCRIMLFYIIPICVHLLNCHFYISSSFNSTTRQSTIATELVFRRLKRSMVALILTKILVSVSGLKVSSSSVSDLWVSCTSLNIPYDYFQGVEAETAAIAFDTL